MDFAKTIEETVESCDVLIAVIGTHWLTSTDGQGGRRLDNPEDWVRTEIATALRRDIRVIPVLVDGALMPAELARQEKERLEHESRAQPLPVASSGKSKEDEPAAETPKVIHPPPPKPTEWEAFRPTSLGCMTWEATFRNCAKIGTTLR